MTNVYIALSSLLAFVSYIVYIRAIVSGNARPHRTTRFITLLITTLSTASLIAQKSTASVWLSAVFMIGSLIIFLLTIRYGMGGRAKTDIACLVISLLGICFWKYTKNPLIALYASLIADLVGQIPMLIKTYRLPETEIWQFYFLDVLAAFFTLFAVSIWTIQEYIFPFYIVFIDGITICLILRKSTLLKHLSS